MKNLNTLTHDKIVNMSQDISLDSETKLQIDNYLKEIKFKIDNLEFVDRLGLKLENNINGKVLSRSNSGKRIDFLAVFLGFLSIPILGIALGLLAKEILYGKLTTSNFIPIAILFAIGGALFALFLQGWNRKLMFAGFTLEKNNSNFKVRRMSNFKSTETIFSIDSKLSALHHGEKVLVILTENDQENILFTLPKLSTIQNETLNALIAKFN